MTRTDWPLALRFAFIMCAARKGQAYWPSSSAVGTLPIEPLLRSSAPEL